MDPRTLERAGLSALVAALLYVYLPVFGAPPVDWDDGIWVIEDPILTGPWSLAWTTTRDNVYAPLLRLSFAAQHAAFEGWTGFHAVRIGLFLAGTLGLYALLRRLRVEGALAAVALWALHPSKVEVLAWITALKDVQSFALLIGAALCLVPAEGGRARVWEGTALGVGALLTKAAVFPLPFVLAGLVAALRGREAARAFGPLCAAAVGLALVGAAVWAGPDGQPALPWSRVWLPLWVNGLFVEGLWPGARVVVHPVPASPWPTIFWGVAATAAWAWHARGDARSRAALVVWAGALAPFLGIVAQMSYWGADRHLLIASLGPALLAGWALARAPWAAALVGAWFAAQSSARVPDWLDWHRLWEVEAERPGEIWIRSHELGMVRALEGKFGEAADAFEDALRQNPGRPETLAAWVVAELGADGWTKDDVPVAKRFQPLPADAAAWAAGVEALRAHGRPDLADVVARQAPR